MLKLCEMDQKSAFGLENVHSVSTQVRKWKCKQTFCQVVLNISRTAVGMVYLINRGYMTLCLL